MAAEEAERLGVKHVGTEHLLLGILREEKCFGAEILMERGRLDAAGLPAASTVVVDQSSGAHELVGPIGVGTASDWLGRGFGGAFHVEVG